MMFAETESLLKMQRWIQLSQGRLLEVWQACCAICSRMMRTTRTRCPPRSLWNQHCNQCSESSQRLLSTFICLKTLFVQLSPHLFFCRWPQQLMWTVQSQCDRKDKWTRCQWAVLRHEADRQNLLMCKILDTTNFKIAWLELTYPTLKILMWVIWWQRGMKDERAERQPL